MHTCGPQSVGHRTTRLAIAGWRRISPRRRLLAFPPWTHSSPRSWLNWYWPAALSIHLHLSPHLNAAAGEAGTPAAIDHT